MRPVSLATLTAEELSAYVRGRFEEAWREIQVVKRWQLVHGRRVHQGRVIADAWCLIDDDAAGAIVYDPVEVWAGLPDAYFAKYEASEDVRYTAQEAARLAKEHGHYGPWHEGAAGSP